MFGQKTGVLPLMKGLPDVSEFVHDAARNDDFDSFFSSGKIYTDDEMATKGIVGNYQPDKAKLLK